ncbi:HDOD domain-containing protein [Marinobacter salinisoli]|uniref:HDOD domain-containing protein n=1 Tax=Marinobacter salinisoli TaxID=2769486 RepID=A0ABX7MWG8_9GAMM|nr:HDOD domain-containing protein [Marinobacter salinisoli]QSP96503.1 HDOD domain-containing protein [Marinobacter salinisoli]
MAAEDGLLRRLREFQPLDRLGDDQLVLLASRVERRRIGAGQKVAERGGRDGRDVFLLEGKLELATMDGQKTLVEAHSPQAKVAIARRQPRLYDVTAVAAGEIVSIDQRTLNQMLREAPVVRPDGRGERSDAFEEDREHALLMAFYAELRTNQVAVPSLPDVAWKVCRTVDSDESSADDVAMAVSADPAMAAKLVRACNSPLYRGFSEVHSVRDAVVRLGMRTTRQLVTVFSMREVFRAQSPTLKAAMESLWRHSREVAALCWVLADRATRLNPEEAMLAGLLHDIGSVPLLVHAERHASLSRDESLLAEVVRELRADVGASVLESWSFSPAFVESARHAEDWQFESREASPQLADVVIVAQMHSMIGSNQGAELPPFAEVPAYRRLGALGLNASRSLQVLTEARTRVEDVQQLLSIR